MFPLMIPGAIAAASAPTLAAGSGAGALLGLGIANTALSGLGALGTMGWNIGAQMHTWNREDTARQRAVADMRKAGLSPTLAAGSPAPTSAPMQLKKPEIDLAKILQFKMMDAELKGKDRNNELARLQALKLKNEIDYQRDWLDTRNKTKKSEYDFKEQSFDARLEQVFSQANQGKQKEILNDLKIAEEQFREKVRLPDYIIKKGELLAKAYAAKWVADHLKEKFQLEKDKVDIEKQKNAAEIIYRARLIKYYYDTLKYKKGKAVPFYEDPVGMFGDKVRRVFEFFTGGEK